MASDTNENSQESATLEPVEDFTASAPVEEHGGAGEVTETRAHRRRSTDLPPLVMGFIWFVIGAFIVNAKRDTIFPWVLENLAFFLILVVVVVVAAVIFGVRIAWGSATGQISSIVFLGVPLVAVLIGAVWTISPEYRVAVLRCVFLLIVIFLPALLYYLFVVLRRVSLLQEFFTNLATLGLLERRHGRVVESEENRKIRVTTYLQKFEAIYGYIPRPLFDQIIEQSTSDPTPGHAGEPPDFHLYRSSMVTPEAIPVVVTTLLIGLGWLLVLPPWDVGGIKLNLVLKPTEDAVLFAFLGAYFYALQMLFRRFVRRDLRANAYVSISQRIILGVVGMWAVLQVALVPGSIFAGDGAIGAQHASLLVAGFVVGAFPPIAWQVVQALFRKLSNAETLVPSLDSPMPLRQLDGLTVWHEGRLEEEDVENVQNMSTANMVELMLNTRYPPDRIVDWVDQAMLYTQLGTRENGNANTVADSAVARLQSYGIRTASSLVAAYHFSASRGDVAKLRFEEILPGEKDGQSRIPTIVDVLCTNPNLLLVQRWNGTLDVDELAPILAGGLRPAP